MTTNIPIYLGKLPPQAIEVEECILGTLLLYPDSITVCIQYLKAESFYKDANQKVYESILQMFNRSAKIDTITVVEELKKMAVLDEVGGPYYIAQLSNTSSHAKAANIEEHCQIVAEKYIKRELIRIANDISLKAYSDESDTQETIDYAGTEIIKVTDCIALDSIQSIGDLVSQKAVEIEKISTGEIKLSGVPSGLTSLDRVTSGWQSTDLIILAARPSVGKTAFALKLAKEAAQMKYPVAFFSLEMSGDQLALRIIAGETNNTQMELRKGIVSDWKQIDRTVSKCEKIPLFIDDKAGISISQLRSRLIIYKQKFGIRLAIVDYLQLVKSIEKVREQQISNISRTLKLCAKELKIPVIALAQLNRAVDGRAEKKPVLSDLRESGAIEQDADIVMFLTRPEMYDNDAELKGKTILTIAKHRNGSCDEKIFNHNESKTDYWDEGSLQVPEMSSNNDFWYNKEKIDSVF